MAAKNQYILVAGSSVEGFPIPLVIKPHLQDIIDYVRVHLKYYPYEYLAVFTVNPLDALQFKIVGDQIIVQ